LEIRNKELLGDYMPGLPAGRNWPCQLAVTPLPVYALKAVWATDVPASSRKARPTASASGCSDYLLDGNNGLSVHSAETGPRLTKTKSSQPPVSLQ